MTSNEAPDHEATARGIRSMFSGIAGVYDLLNRTLSLRQDVRWRRNAVGLLPARERRNVLDVCGGTGDLGLEVLRQGVAERVVLVDFAAPMVRRAARKRPPDDQWAVTVGDGLALPLPDARFDLVVCAFGVRNLVDLEQAVRAFARVLRPGGELLVLDFMGGQHGTAYGLFRLYFKHILPRVGRWISGHPSAYAYLPASVERFVDTERWFALLERHGFERVAARELTFGIATITLARLPNTESPGRNGGRPNLNPNGDRKRR